jgi:hypothetical protein
MRNLEFLPHPLFEVLPPLQTQPQPSAKIIFAESKVQRVVKDVFTALGTLSAAATFALVISSIVSDTPWDYPLAALSTALFFFTFIPFWESSPDWSISPAEPVYRGACPGIENGGNNTCFVGVALHMLMGTPYEAFLQSSYSQEHPVPQAVQAYNAAKATGPLSVDKVIPVRNLSVTNGPIEMGDAEEMMHVIMRDVDSSQNASNFFSLRIQRQLEEVEGLSTEEKETVDELQIECNQAIDRESINKFLSKKTVIPGGRILSKVESGHFILNVPIDNADNQQGQQLVDRLFIEGISSNDKIYGLEGSKIKCFRIAKEIYSIDRLPDQFFIALQRFSSNGTKNEATVEMPVTLTMQGQEYVLKKIALHVGIHYIAFMDQGDQWEEYNDSRVGVAIPAAVDYARNNGYIYYYTKKVDAADAPGRDT